MLPTTVSLKNRRIAALLAFLVPGLGHAYQGRYGKAILYFVCIYFLFYVGLYLGDGKIVYWRWISPLVDAERFCFFYIAQFFTGLAALPGLIQATLTHYGKPTILWGYCAEPASDQINGLYRPLGKFLEVGFIYTEAAGLLNILAIFDAYEGPAIPEPSADPQPVDASGPTASVVENAS